MNGRNGCVSEYAVCLDKVVSQLVMAYIDNVLLFDKALLYSFDEALPSSFGKALPP